jgi:hypothetical protein
MEVGVAEEVARSLCFARVVPPQHPFHAINARSIKRDADCGFKSVCKHSAGGYGTPPDRTGTGQTACDQCTRSTAFPAPAAII